MLKELIYSMIESRGRKRQYELPKFPDNGILSEAYEFKVGAFGAKYLPSFPMTSAIVISPDGKVQISEGGLIKMPTGSYSVKYIDRRQHPKTLPSVIAETSDGFHVKLTISITYQVTSLLSVLESDNPIESLLDGCNAAIRSIIHIHRHDEFISERPDDQKLSDTQLANEIIRQVSMNRACRAFTLINITILQREGDPKVMEIRQGRLVQERKSLTIEEGLIQQQRIAAQEKILDEMKTKQDVAMKKLRVQFEANREKILHQANLLKVDIERRRKLPQYQHEETIKKLDVGEKIVEALIQAQGMPGFPRTADDLKLIETIMVGFSDIGRSPQNESPEHIDLDNDETSSTLIHLMIPKK